MDALPLADEIFLVGHDEDTGKPVISDDGMDTVLAGAVLGELVFTGRIGVTAETLVVPYGDTPSGDPVCDGPASEIIKQNQHHPVRAWVEHLRGTVRPLVADRVLRTGLVDRVESRVMLKTTVRYPAKDRIAAGVTVARLRYMLQRPDDLDEQTATVAGLVLAGNLEFVVGGASGREIRTSLLQMVQTLRPELRLLVAGVESAVAALALRR